MNAATPHDIELARLYQAFVLREWRAPHVREFAAMAGVSSSSTAAYRLQRLVTLKLIKRGTRGGDAAQV